MPRRVVILVAAGADVVTGIAVFLPWAGVSGNPASLAGWGTSATPRLLGLFVIACAATALSFRCGVLATASEERVGPHVAAALLDGVAAILALLVLTGAGAFVGTNLPATPRAGSLLAFAAAAVGVAAGVIAVATAAGRDATEPG